MVTARPEHRLDIRIVHGDITAVEARAYVLGIFQDVAPSGAARAVDEKVEGAIAEFTARRMFSGASGSVFMLPTSRHMIPAETVIFTGLGSFDAFNGQVQRFAAENAARALVHARIGECATVLLGASGSMSAGEGIENLLHGFLAGLRDADTARHFHSLTVCEIDRTRFNEMKARLKALSRGSFFAAFDVRLSEVRGTLPRVRRPSIQPDAETSKDPVYLLVRQENANTEAVSFSVSLLSAGGKATVITAAKDIPLGVLHPHLAQLETFGWTLAAMRKFGESLGAMVLPPDIRKALLAMQDRHVVVVHDAETSRIPWETLALRINGRRCWIPAAACGLSRRYAAQNLSLARWLETRRRDETLSILLVANPTEDLPAAEEEGRRIEKLATKHSGVSLRVLRGRAAAKPVLLELFQSGEFDIVHYAGHAFFDPAQPSQSGIVAARGALLLGGELANLSHLPGLVFFNACEAGRVRKGIAASSPLRAAAGAGLAEAFLRGGVANYVGTYWPVGDMSASVFARVFYRDLLKGSSIGAALLHGRREVAKQGSADWADYMHYGDFNFQLKKLSS